MGDDLGGWTMVEEGTTFQFSIPLSTAPHGAGQPLDASRPAEPPLDSPWSSLRVMVVDDVEANTFVLKHKLYQRQVQEVTTCLGGNECIDAFQADPYCSEIVFMDLWMPVPDEWSTTAQLREMGVSVPVVGISADSDPEARQEALATGMDRVFVKPLQWDKVFADVQSSLKHRKPPVGRLDSSHWSLEENLQVP